MNCKLTLFVFGLLAAVAFVSAGDDKECDFKAKMKQAMTCWEKEGFKAVQKCIGDMTEGKDKDKLKEEWKKMKPEEQKEAVMKLKECILKEEKVLVDGKLDCAKHEEFINANAKADKKAAISAAGKECCKADEAWQKCDECFGKKLEEICV